MSGDAAAWVLGCVSAGFFIKRDKAGLVIGQSLGNAEVGNVKAIPPACVRSIEVLSRAKRRNASDETRG